LRDHAGHGPQDIFAGGASNFPVRHQYKPCRRNLASPNDFFRLMVIGLMEPMGSTARFVGWRRNGEFVSDLLRNWEMVGKIELFPGSLVLTAMKPSTGAQSI
jgi:hypothetical protein